MLYDKSISEKNVIHFIKKVEFILYGADKIKKRKGNCNVLDFGCGTGNISFQLANIGCNVLGIDIHKETIDYAKKKNKFKKCKFKAKDIISLGNKKYDLVVCSEVFHYIDNIDKVFRKISEILNKDGALIITSPNKRGPFELSNKPRRFLGNFLRNAGLYPTLNNLRTRITKRNLEKSNSLWGADTLNHGEGSVYKNEFSIGNFKNLAEKNNLRILKIKNSNFISGVDPLSYIYFRSEILQKFDCKLADFLPNFMASAWYIKLKKNEN